MPSYVCSAEVWDGGRNDPRDGYRVDEFRRFTATIEVDEPTDLGMAFYRLTGQVLGLSLIHISEPTRPIG